MLHNYNCRATGLPFWLGQILPFVAMNIFNWVVFIMIIVSVYKKRTPDVQAKKSYKSHLTMTVGLATLFGLGWGFGLAASSMPIKELTFTFSITFQHLCWFTRTFSVLLSLHPKSKSMQTMEDVVQQS